jgi:hypothetical protein
MEFATPPANMPAFERRLDESLCQLNVYYKDLIDGKILSTLVVSPLNKGAFQEYMKSQGKLGGQNKVPRLSKERLLADSLLRLQF